MVYSSCSYVVLTTIINIEGLGIPSALVIFMGGVYVVEDLAECSYRDLVGH